MYNIMYKKIIQFSLGLTLIEIFFLPIYARAMYSPYEERNGDMRNKSPYFYKDVEDGNFLRNRKNNKNEIENLDDNLRDTISTYLAPEVNFILGMKEFRSNNFKQSLIHLKEAALHHNDKAEYTIGLFYSTSRSLSKARLCKGVGINFS